MSGKSLAMWHLVERRVDDVVLAGRDPIVRTSPGMTPLRLLGCRVRLDATVPLGVAYIIDEGTRTGVKITGLGDG